MKLYFGNLPKSVSNEQLSEMAAPFGTIVSADVAKDRESGNSKGFGFVEYGTAEEGQAAITGLNGKEFSGQALKVNEAKPKRDREPATN